MNIFLLSPAQQLSETLFKLTSRQSEHLQKIIKPNEGDLLRVGLLNGQLGLGCYQVIDQQPCLNVSVLKEMPPPALPLTVILALPRPNMLKRTLLNLACMGVKEIVLLQSAKVEKSYWQSPVLSEDSIQSILYEGLEQSRDTVLPSVRLEKRFRPFVEDELPQLTDGKRKLLAHPYLASVCPVALSEEAVLAIGPEGGWNEFEVEKWQQVGFESVHLGPRILKVETAVPVLLSRLYPAG